MMVMLTILSIVFFAYIAGALGEGMNQTWKTHVLMLFFVVTSLYLCVALVGQVSSNPL
jgi:hypothetical protein